MDGFPMKDVIIFAWKIQLTRLAFVMESRDISVNVEQMISFVFVIDLLLANLARSVLIEME